MENLKYLKLNKKSMQEVKSKNWTFGDIEEHFNKDFSLNTYFLEKKSLERGKSNDYGYFIIYSGDDSNSLQVLMLDREIHKFIYSDLIIVKVPNNCSYSPKDNEEVEEFLKSAIDFEDYEVEAFMRWHKNGMWNGDVFILDAMELLNFILVQEE